MTEDVMLALLDALPDDDEDRVAALALLELLDNKNCTQRELQNLGEAIKIDELGEQRRPSAALTEFFDWISGCVDARQARPPPEALPLGVHEARALAQERVSMIALPEVRLLDALLGESSHERVMDEMTRINPCEIMFPDVVECAVRQRIRWFPDDAVELEAGLVAHWIERAIMSRSEMLRSCP